MNSSIKRNIDSGISKIIMICLTAFVDYHGGDEILVAWEYSSNIEAE